MKGIGPCQREGVGGSIKRVTGTIGFFSPCLTVKAIDGDEDMFFRSPVMQGVSWNIAGITKDSTGAVLGSCTVHLFYTGPDQFISATTSDSSTGAYSFKIGPTAGPFYVVAYKAGSPDVAGTTVNTLTPVAT